MKKNTLAFFSLCICILFSACSTSVNLRIKRAPEINLIGVKTLKLEEFKFSGDLNLDVVDNPGGLVGVILDVGVGVGAYKMAEKKHSALQFHHIEGLKNAFYNNGFYNVTDGINHDATISGTIYYEIEDKAEQKESKDKEGNVSTWFEIARRATVTVNFSIHDKKGNLLGTSMLKTWQRDVSKGDTKDQARDKITPFEKLLRSTLDKSNPVLVTKIAPHFVYERRVFAKGKHKSIKIGNKIAKQGDWSGAADSWSQALNASDKKDRAAALFNLAIYDEVEGKLQEALKKYEEASSLMEGKYARDVSRTRARIAEAERLREAEEAQ